MSIKQAKVTNLIDYQAPQFELIRSDLHFDLALDKTRVSATTEFQRISEDANADKSLKLNGKNLELVSIRLNQAEFPEDAYIVDDEYLTIFSPPDRFTLEIVNQISPENNKTLTGLFQSGDMLCTQCEAQGFRHITYYLDRPDIMSPFTTTIIADKAQFPILLSNGNCIKEGELNDGKHFVTWQDPFKKPCYLFALVAGDLDVLEDQFNTQSGRSVTIKLFVEKGNLDKCAHAMESIKQAMRWDEERFGREYDLDIFMVVAVSTFNMGAMENKGLNIFNDQYILAKPETATDADFYNIQSVIGHEYFHNWTGNRVTCRDWFQLSLKEGLTIYRDQEFSADMNSRAVARIDDVRALRNSQFSEDAGPMAHPVRPESYLTIDNFYTATIYNKGAEVIRMQETLLGREGFRKGMDLYFKRHDGQAVTTDDFVKAMGDANDFDMEQFLLWYRQSGTPIVKIERQFDENRRLYHLKMTQECFPTPEQDDKQAFLIPIRLAFINKEGQAISLANEKHPCPNDETECVMQLKQREQTFTFSHVPESVVPSVLRYFSAPVKVEIDYSPEELSYLMQYDTDLFNRYEASQRLALHSLLKLVEQHKSGEELSIEEDVLHSYAKVLESDLDDKALLTELLILPSEKYIGEQLDTVDVDAVHAARNFMRKQLAEKLETVLWDYYSASNKNKTAYEFSATAMGERSFKNCALSYLMQLNQKIYIDTAVEQCHQADNMTDEIAAFSSLVNCDCSEREEVIEYFYQRWQSENLVINKWFFAQARCELSGTLSKVQDLMNHETFDSNNPNKVRALVAAFCFGNIVQFHSLDGRAYQFLANQVMNIDVNNPQLAARLLEPLIQWKRFDQQRQSLMKLQLEYILTKENISDNVHELAHKSLHYA